MFNPELLVAQGASGIEAYGPAQGRADDDQRDEDDRHKRDRQARDREDLRCGADRQSSRRMRTVIQSAAMK